jgi:tetratricopeptide (TPR) repeat protein
MITQELLDELWDFSDPAGSERRFAAEAASLAHTDAERAELLTQQARALGLQERFGEGRALLDSLGHEADAAARTRVKLEAGRLLNSAGNTEDAVIEFEEALTVARSGGLLFLEIDALHMLAIADRARSSERAAEAIDRALEAPDDRTRRWLVSLYNNLGCSSSEDGDLDQALAAFRRAQEWAELIGTEQQRVWAREAVEECAAALELAEAKTAVVDEGSVLPAPEAA